MSSLPTNLYNPLTDLLFSIADDKLILGHRNSDWTGLGPILEEDIAFSHLAQDEMAHAQAIYQFIGELTGQSADEMAFGRPPEEYRCAHIVEVPDEFDWATAIARKFYCDHFDRIRLARLAKSSHKPLADLANRLVIEEQIHVEHVDSWIPRLAQGTNESKTRLQNALTALAPLASMLFESSQGEAGLTAAGVYPHGEADMFTEWHGTLQRIGHESGLTLKLLQPDPNTKAGRRGIHTPHLTELLDEMCEVYRLEPNAAW